MEYIILYKICIILNKRPVNKVVNEMRTSFKYAFIIICILKLKAQFKVFAFYLLLPLIRCPSDFDLQFDKIKT